MILTQLCIMATGFLDTAMAGRYSSVDLAGISIAGNILWPLFVLLSGITMALTPIVSQMRGRRTVDAAGPTIAQGLWVTLITSTILIVALTQCEPLLAIMQLDPAMIRVAMDYLHAVAWGIPAVTAYVALRHACEGLGEPRPPMRIAAAVLPINALLNYGFIYGRWGLPELGGEGCGWATAIVFWLQLLLMIRVVRQPLFRQTGLLSRFHRPDWHSVRRILRLGIPIGLAGFTGMTLFAVISLLIGRMGVTELAAHSIVGNINWLTYVLPMGLGAAASIRVGYFVGADDLDAARHSAFSAYRFALGYAVVVSLALVLCRHILIAIYTEDTSVATLAAGLILFVAVYQIFDDTQAVGVGALRGYKDTRTPMWIELFGYWCIALPLGYILADRYASVLPSGTYGYWIGLTAGLAVVATLISVRLYRTSCNPARIRTFATA